MYRKITDGFDNIESQKAKEIEAQQKLIEQPMSYFMCPICNNLELETCSCSGGYTNYYCGKCQFKHTNHHHNSTISNGNISTTKNVDKIIISKNIRSNK